jgi:hypothetical protein
MTLKDKKLEDLQGGIRILVDTLKNSDDSGVSVSAAQIFVYLLSDSNPGKGLQLYNLAST